VGSATLFVAIATNNVVLVRSEEGRAEGAGAVSGRRQLSTGEVQSDGQRRGRPKRICNFARRSGFFLYAPTPRLRLIQKTTLAMKRHFLLSVSPAVFAALLAVRVYAADPVSAGYVDFGKFLPPDSDGKYVEVNIKENLLKFAAIIAKAQEPEAAKLIGGLKLVRVNVVEMNDKNRTDLTERIGKVRADLETHGWERTVTVKDNGDDVAIFVKTGNGSAIEGLVVTVLGHNHEAVFVNVVGNIDPEQISTIAAKFNIPELKNLPGCHKNTPPAETAPKAEAS
jgi:hypothetical protein